MVNKVIFLKSGTTWVVPTDWNNASFTIEALGAGGGGCYGNELYTPNAGGGGGAYAKIVSGDATFTNGATVYIQVGVGGSAGVPGASPAVGGAGTDTWLNQASNAVPTLVTQGLRARRGAGGTGSPGAGGDTTNSVGSTKYAGGTGRDDFGYQGGAGGGGGSAGPSGAGGNGDSGSSSGGTANGGLVAGGLYGVNWGGSGINNGGAGSQGNASTIWTQTSNSETAGPGSGGGGGGSPGDPGGSGGGGGAGGLYGGAGGGGGGGSDGQYGAGGGIGRNGIIVITYEPLLGGPRGGIIW